MFSAAWRTYEQVTVPSASARTSTTARLYIDGLIQEERAVGAELVVSAFRYVKNKILTGNIPLVQVWDVLFSSSLYFFFLSSEFYHSTSNSGPKPVDRVCPPVLQCPRVNL